MTVFVLAGCEREGDTIVVPNPYDPVPNKSPLVTVIYDPDALGDRSYNDLIYQGVEEAAKRYGLRTLQLSPRTVAEGEAYIETLLSQLAAATDTVRYLTIIAGTSYDRLLRSSNRQLEANERAGLLYLETDTPLEGKGSTLYLPYYGAMYEAGAITPLLVTNTVIIGSNPVDKTVNDAIAGFCDGFNANWFNDIYDERIEHNLYTVFLADNAGQGYNIPDSIVMRIIRDIPVRPIMFVPICGGASMNFRRIADTMNGGYLYMGIDRATPSLFCYHSVVKHIDRAVSLCIGQWLSDEGMPKHQRLGLASGFTEMVLHPTQDYVETFISSMVTDELRTAIHEEAIRIEELND